MNILLIFVVTTVGVINLTEARVFPKPMNEDRKYWHDYNIKYVKNILKSHPGVKAEKAKNVILFVGDGMSIGTISAGRVLKGQLAGNSGEETDLIFESFSHLGLSKTYNTDSQVPDSAGTATALFSGIKTAIKAIGLNMDDLTKCRESDRLKTIIDWAQEKGMRTGVVTTTRITHATPAAAYSFSPSRNYECDVLVPESLAKTGFKDIARQLVENSPGNKLNVIFGGGRDFLGANIEWDKEVVKFAGGAEISCNRTDGRNLVNDYLKQFDNSSNVKYVTNTGELFGLEFSDVDHVLGLFANNHMPYESLRNTESIGQPSLTEMTEAAIKILSNKKNDNGFVLIVEGGKIDQAHHQNHARLALEEFVEFEKAIRKAKEMTSEHDTLIIVTSDHSHAMVYNGYPKRGNDILGFANKENSTLYETIVYATGPGSFYHKLNDSSSQKLIEIISPERRREPLYMHESLIPMKDATHSGEDVPVFSHGPNSFLLQRTFEQSYIPYAISYSACIGPIESLNPACSYSNKANGKFKQFNLYFMAFVAIVIYMLIH